MPLMPKRVKHRKVHRGSLAGNAHSNNKLDFGDFGLQVLDRGWITNRQIEAARVAATRHMRRRGKLFIRLFPDHSVSKKPLETRMGKGKGNVETWVARVRPGRVIFEIAGVPAETARAALARAASKLALPCKMLTREMI